MKPPVISYKHTDKILMGFLIVMVAVMSVVGIYDAITSFDYKRLAKTQPESYSKCSHCPDYYPHKKMQDIGNYTWFCRDEGTNMCASRLSRPMKRFYYEKNKAEKEEK